MGTVFYMSPEQVQGSKIDQRSDIYSLGVTFYQMLTGVKPYNELTTEFEIYSRIVKDDLPSPQEVYPGVPDFLVSILKKAMEKNPNANYNFQIAQIYGEKGEYEKIIDLAQTEVDNLIKLDEILKKENIDILIHNKINPLFQSK